MSEELIHASTVAIRGEAVLIAGPSGAGKSDLALRLIDRGAVLVSDDYTVVRLRGDDIMAAPPETIAGRIEVRGLGVVSMPYLSGIPVALAVRLDATVERMPAEGHTRLILGLAIPEVTIDSREASAPIKVELALHRLLDSAI